MLPARDPLYEGPVVIVSGRVAALMSHPLKRLVREARDRGERLDAEMLATAHAIERAGQAYVHGRVMGTSEGGPSSRPSADLLSSSTGDGWFSTSEVADRLDCTERHVVRLIADKRLASTRIGVAHRIERSELARYMEDRKQTA